MKHVVLVLAVLLFACTEDQSRAIGQQPKKTIERVTSDVNKAMQHGSERLKEDEK